MRLLSILKKQSSSYKNAFWVLGLVSLLIVFLLSSIFASSIGAAVNKVRIDQDLQICRAFDNYYEDLWKKGDLSPKNFSKRIQSYLISQGSIASHYVLLATPTGELLYRSDLPQTLEEKLSLDLDTGKFYLPDPYLFGRYTKPSTQNSQILIFVSANYFGVKDTNYHYLNSVIYPIQCDGELVAILQIHRTVAPFGDFIEYMFPALSLTLLLGIVVTIIFVLLFNKVLVTPVDQFCLVAEAVSKGDFSVRVPIEKTQYETHLLSDDTVVKKDEIARLAETFNSMLDSLEHQKSEQRDFIASVSHDLKTPLTSINGFLQAIIDGTISPEFQERYLKIILQETQRISVLLAEMNDAVLTDLNEIRYEMCAVDIHKLIQEVVKLLSPQIDKKHLSVSMCFSCSNKDSLLLVKGDKEQLRRVLLNLIHNAVKFTPDDGVIRVSCSCPRRSGTQVCITIEDNGQGIDKEDLPYIFNRFFKSDRSRSGRSGTGLGLWNCQQILSAHGQRISAGHSKNLGGAKFSFTLDLML